MSRTAPGIAALLLAAGPFAPAAAQMVSLTRAGEATAVVNQLGVPILAQVVGRSGSAETAGIVTVAARSTARVPASGEVPFALARLEVLDRRVGVALRPVCPAEDPRDPAQAIMSARATMDSLRFSESREAIAAVEAEVAIARLDLEQRMDSLKLFFHDPLREEADRQYWNSVGGLRAVYGSSVQNLGRQAEEALAGAAMLALAADAGRQARMSKIGDERDLLKPLAENSDSAELAVRTWFARVSRQFLAFDAFHRSVAAGLPALPPAAGSRGRLQVSRWCPGPAGLEDPVRVTGLRVPGQAMLNGELQFDRGGSVGVVFRYHARDDAWYGTIAWGPEATRGHLVLEGVGRLGTELRPDRRSARGALADAIQAIRAIKKRYREARFRADGADELKGVIVP